MKQRVPINYKQHKSIFQKIKKEQRSNWLKNMLQTKQKTGQYQPYRTDYPQHGKWTFKDCQHHYYYSLNEVQPSKAILFYFPGLNAHGNGSAYFTTNVAKKCHIDIYSLDYKNFGRSGGQERGYIQSAITIIEQAQNFIDYILSKQKQKKKIFICGLSLGGAVCFKLALRRPQKYDGIIFLSPALKQNKQVSPFMKKIGKAMGTWFPRLKLINQTFDSMTKYDIRQIYENDPYLYKGKVIPGSIKVVLDLMEEIQTQWNKFTNPFLLIQSGVDKLVDPFLAIDFEKQCKSQDKTVIYFKDMWHAVFAQDEMPDVIQATIQWLAPRTNN